MVNEIEIIDYPSIIKPIKNDNSHFFDIAHELREMTKKHNIQIMSEKSPIEVK